MGLSPDQEAMYEQKEVIETLTAVAAQARRRYANHHQCACGGRRTDNAFGRPVEQYHEGAVFEHIAGCAMAAWERLQAELPEAAQPVNEDPFAEDGGK